MAEALPCRWRMFSQARRIPLCFLCVIACAPIVVTTPTVAASTGVKGALEEIDQSGIVSGWAQDPSNPSLSIQVHLYVDGTAGGGGTFAAAVSANVPSTEPAGAHGFRYSIPSKYRDGEPHTLYAYGIASSGMASDNMLLSSEPQTFVLESTVVRLDNGIIQFGVEPRCGGTLVEVSWRGRNFVNNADCTGRQVQAALYDGNATYDSCSGCQGNWGWDPVQGGDIHNFGSPLLAKRVTPDSVYIATRPNEWYPDNKGGGPGRPVPSDVMIEQTASFVPDYPYAVRLHYRITHLNSDTHASAVQEFPAVWVNQEYDRFVSYDGTRPWTGRPVTASLLTGAGQAAPVRYVSEHWAALVNAQGVGLTVYVPNQYPYAVSFQLDGTSGEFGSGANYFRPHVPYMFGPGSVLEGDVYVIAGDYRQARQDIEAMYDAKPPSGDTLPPFGALDMPLAGQDVTDVVSVAGWFLDDVGIARVEILLDGKPVGMASYGIRRPDVATVYPYASEQIGFSYPLDTRPYANGSHQLLVRAADKAGNVAVLPGVSIVIHNGE
jgi:Bacterial Ig domain